jgi:Uncharacterized conserved protein
MIFQIIGAFIAVIAFSIVLEVPKKYLCSGGLIGAIGWAVYLLIVGNLGIVRANFFSALIIALLAHIFARILKAPVTIFLIAGIMTLVPGGIIYKAVYNFTQGERVLASKYLNETLAIAGMIALAIFVVDSFFRILSDWKIKDRK